MAARDPDALTDREREVLGLLRVGLTNEEIAERLGITLDGAKYHVSQILSKLGVATREEAVLAAEDAGAGKPRLREGERRGWWAVLPLAAKAAGAALVVAAVAGLGVLAWGVWETNDPSGQPPIADYLMEPQVSFRICAADPNWVQPSFDWVLSDDNGMYYYIRGGSEDGIREVYEQRIYMVFPGTSVNLGWIASTGLAATLGPPGCPGIAQRVTGRQALFALARFEPVTATRQDDDIVVRVRETERGWGDLELTLDPPLGLEYSISFVDDSGDLVASFPSGDGQ